MSLADPDQRRTRFRRPVGVAVMAYKTILGLSEIVVGLLWRSRASTPRPPSSGCRPTSCARTPATAS
jgi:hypothetical protein